MSLDYVKKLTADNEIVEAIYERVEGRLLKRLSKHEINKVPEELEYIVEEVTIARFNRVGSEGMKSESVEGHSVTYEDGDWFAAYEKAIADFLEDLKEEDEQKLGVVYFL